MKRLIQTIALAVGCIVLLLPNGASAAGYANIGGASGIQIYYNERTITYPPTSGPEVAFIQYSAGSLSLGAHSCGGSYWGLKAMTPGVWKTVYTTPTPKVFCLYSTANYAWNGDLSWD